MDGQVSSRHIDRSPSATSEEGRHDNQAFTGPSEDEDRQISESMEQSPDTPQGVITQGPGRLVVHDDGREQLLALTINEDLVTATQEIYDETRKLQQHQELFDNLQSEISAADEQLFSVKAALADAEGEEARALERSIDRQESALEIALERRDRLCHDMNAFNFNLRFAHKASHDILRNLMEGAGLLVKPPPTPDISENQDSPTDHTTMANHENMYSSEEELSRINARRELYDLEHALDLAQREFDNMEASYDVAYAIYTQSRSRGEETMTQVDFDNSYLLSCRKITRDLINAEQALKAAKAHAVAIGALDSLDDGELFGGWMGEWCPESEPVDEHCARQALRDWTPVETWMAEVRSSDGKEDESDAGGVDCWEAETVGLGESNSVVAEVEWYREKIDFWKNACAQLRREMQGDRDGVEVR